MSWEDILKTQMNPIIHKPSEGNTITEWSREELLDAAGVTEDDLKERKPSSIRKLEKLKAAITKLLSGVYEVVTAKYEEGEDPYWDEDR